MVAVDMLKVPVSTNGNQYLLVAQDYYSKWPFAKAMPGQKAERIVQILRDEMFTLVRSYILIIDAILRVES